MKCKRDFPGMFDVAKGILMLLVILGHQKGFFRTFLGIEHPLLPLLGPSTRYDVVIMGLFFIMAGYTTHAEKDLKSFLKKNARAICVPYLWTMVALAALMSARYLLTGGFRFEIIRPILLGFLYGNGIAGFQLPGGFAAESVGAAWFLLALFWSGLIHQLFLRIPKPAAREAAIWCFTAAAVAFPSAHQLQLPWCIVPGCAAVGLRELGRLLKAHKILYRDINWPFAAAAAALTTILHLVSTAKFWSNTWQFWMLDYLSAAAIGVVLLQCYAASGLAAARFTDGLAYIGRYSLFFFCLHNIEMLLFPWQKLYTRLIVPSHLPWGAAFPLMYLSRVALAVAGCHLILWASGRFKKFRRSRT